MSVVGQGFPMIDIKVEITDAPAAHLQGYRGLYPFKAKAYQHWVSILAGIVSYAILKVSLVGSANIEQ